MDKETISLLIAVLFGIGLLILLFKYVVFNNPGDNIQIQNQKTVAEQEQSNNKISVNGVEIKGDLDMTVTQDGETVRIVINQ